MITSLFWELIYRIHPIARSFVLNTGLMKHSGRQPYLIGTLKSEISTEELFNYLKTQGYEHNRIAWVDEGEVLSIRKINGIYQYHIRVHDNGEVRAHYEYAPESRPIRHILDQVIDQSGYFIELLGRFLHDDKKFLNYSHINKTIVEK